MTAKVLFLCSGNYYRSRYAEEMFNYHASRQALRWRAHSRALHVDGLELNVGPISRHAVEAFRKKNIVPRSASRFPVTCDLVDLKGAELVIAMKEAEHRPLMRARFPELEEMVTYWHVDDIDVAHPKEVLPLIDRLISGLILELHPAHAARAR